MNIFEKFFLWSGVMVALLGLTRYPNLSITGLGIGVIGVGFLPRALWGGTKLTADVTRRAITNKMNQIAEEARYKKEQERRELEWQDNLRREIIREKEISKVRNESQLVVLQNQMNLLIKYKEQGADIDKEIFEMRKEILKLEAQENTEMMENLKKTLSDI